MTIAPSDVMRALELVKLPASGGSLAASGRVGGVVVDGPKVMLSIAIDPTEAPAMEPVRLAAESAVKGLPGVTQALVALTADRAPAKPSPAQAARAAAAAGGATPKAAGVPGIRHIIAVASGKGGSASRRPPPTWRWRSRLSASRSACSTPTSTAPPCQGLRRQGQAAPRLGAHARADGGLWAEDHVDRLPHRGGDADDLARADGDLRHHADAARGRLGRA